MHCAGFEIESVDQQDINNRAIYGLRFPVKFKSIKVAHIPLNKQLYVHRWLKGGKAVPPNCKRNSLIN